MDDVKKFITRYSRDFDGRHVEDPNGAWVLHADAWQLDRKIRNQLDAQRLRADTAEAELAECKRKHLRSCQIAIGKSQLAKERHAQLIEAEEIRASWQNGYDVKCQNILLLTLANRELRSLLQRVIDSSVLSFEADAPEELESLEVDICAALSTASPATINPKPEAGSHE